MSRAIIFDLDGTLVDSCAICVSILENMIADRGGLFSIDHETARPLMSRGGATMVATLLGEYARNPEADLADFRLRYAGTVTPQSALFDGVKEGICRLANLGFDLAICSNKPQGLCEQVLTDTGLDEYFRVIVGGKTGIAPKPAPDLLDHTLRALRLSTEHCVFVGDSELDYEVAKAAGMDFFFLTHGYAHPDWQPSECHVFDDFPVLCSALTNHVFADASLH